MSKETKESQPQPTTHHEPHKNWWDRQRKAVKAIIIVAILIAGLALITLYNKGSFNGLINPNDAPEIVYAYPGYPVFSNQLSANSSTAVALSELRAGIIDKNGDKLTVTFWMRSNSGPWNGIALFEGYNGTYVYHLSPPYLITYLSLHRYEWRVDATDGIATTSRNFTMYAI
jgi:hypothetical protein